MNSPVVPTYEEYHSWYIDHMGEDVTNPFSFQSGLSLRTLEGDNHILARAKLDHAFSSFMSRLDKFTASSQLSPLSIPNCESLLDDCQYASTVHDLVQNDKQAHSLTESINFINDISFAPPVVVTERIEVPIHVPVHASTHPSTASNSNSNASSAPPSKLAKTGGAQTQTQGQYSNLNKGRVSPPQDIYDLSEDMADEYSMPAPKSRAQPTQAHSTHAPSASASKPNPFQSAKEQYIKEGAKFPPKPQAQAAGGGGSKSTAQQSNLPPELERYDPALIERVEADIIQDGAPVEFKDIAGLEFAKKCVTEMIVWPMSRPDLFQGLRSLPKGLLLFGPPGTGKTLIGKAIAHQSGATFFCISSSSLTSKWIGEGEKTVRALFAVAAYRQPSVVFIDEVDSLLCQRSSDENEASRRMKTEFLVQLDGAGTDQTARVVIIGATNRPDELDEAARRRFVKRIYIPLPDMAGRKQLIDRLLRDCSHSMTEIDIDELAQKTAGYSGADIRHLCSEAAMGPMRELAAQCGNLRNIRASDVPSIDSRHFWDAFQAMAPSVSQADLQRYIDWNSTFGSFRRME